jgi:hypothetical protein
VIAEKWASFVPRDIGAGTIFYIAQQYGWDRAAAGQQDAANEAETDNGHDDPAAEPMA